LTLRAALEDSSSKRTKHFTTKSDARYHRERLHNNLRGIEKKSLPYLLCMMNLLLHGVDQPRVVHDNALVRMRGESNPTQQVNVVLTNPPFGGEEEDSVAKLFPQGYQTQETAWLFVRAILDKIKPGGRCAIILPNGSLFGGGVGARIKDRLMKDCDLHTIVRLPQGVFAPYTQIPTNLLFFSKTGPTRQTWFYHIPLPEGRRGYTKTKPMQFDEFDECVKWWGGETRQGREENEFAWRAPIADIKENGYNLDLSNPHVGDDLAHRPPQELIAEMIKTEQQILELLAELRADLESGR
jgi:type I restriction enzyme M protein